MNGILYNERPLVRLNNSTPLLIDEVTWPKGIKFKEHLIQSNATKYSRKFSSALKQAVWDKTDGYCYYCGKKLKPWQTFSIDHVIPVIQGGTDDLENLVPSCKQCNARKGAKVGKW